MTGSLIERVRLRLATGDFADSYDGRLLEVDSAARIESDLLVDSTTLAQLTDGLSADLTGAGPLEPLLAMPGVTDVLVHRHDQVWIDRGIGLERTDVRFADDASVRRLASRLASQAGRRLDDSAPFVDASLPDGTRLHAILPPLVGSPAISLRVLARRRLNTDQLVAAGAMSTEVGELLSAIVRARLSLLISGGTGTGKTTLLAALLGAVPPAERIITVEDAAELALDHPHVIALVSRAPNIEGAGSVPMAELVRQALRMRPDRLVVGEFRGAEIAELLGALNTGHDGGAATVHANSVRDVPARLLALAALAGMGADALQAQAASALDVLVHLRRRAGRRYVDEIALWSRDPRTPPALVWSAGSGLGEGAAQLRRRLQRDESALPHLISAC